MPAREDPPAVGYKPLTSEAIYDDILEQLFCVRGRFPEVATTNDFYIALALSVRNRLFHRWISTAHTYFRKASRTVAYLSAEYLMGPQLGNNLMNLGIYEQAAQAVSKFGISLKDLLDHEEEPGLGNGGLGRLAACYLDSMATLEIPAFGYGLRYEFGIFDQEILDGWQVETADKWLLLGNPWEIPQHEIRYMVPFGGHTEQYRNSDGHPRVRWVPDRIIQGTAYDTAVLGYGVNTVNMLRLWKAEARESLNIQAFNVGDYYRAVEQSIESENITRILYPNDQAPAGKQLRLEQEFFLVSCSLQDMIRIYMQKNKNLYDFNRKYAMQLNDTHPALAVAELMRLLVDEYLVEWDRAWDITRSTIAYTNHTLLPEALEKWPLPLFGALLPRHLELVFEINRRFLDTVRVAYPGDDARVRELSLIEEGGEKQVRMANLACVGSNAVNGVSELHTRLLKETVLKEFHALEPEKFHNVTNGVTPRRFMALSNRGLARLISDRIGPEWIRDLSRLTKLEQFVNDAKFRKQWRAVKQENKKRLAALVERRTGIALDPEAMFDIQVKRIHEYKRQLLNILHAITLRNRIHAGTADVAVPRVLVFGGKAAPGYMKAKLIIKLINSVAESINNDPIVAPFLKVAFFPDFNVKNAEYIYPAADLSEQISTAGKEASGTGNMKFTLNGALTIGTLDGANVEIREAVGEDNFFLFGLTAEQVVAARAQGYDPRAILNSTPELREAIELIDSGFFSEGNTDLFKPITGALVDCDRFMIFADYASYVECQERVSTAYSDTESWTTMSILNTARGGRFSSDRAIAEYCRKIWKVKPVNISTGG